MKIIRLIIAVTIINTTFAKSPKLDLAVYQIRKTNPSYADFCQRWPGECDLSGTQELNWTPELQATLEQVNLDVNNTIDFVLDGEQYDQEEYWNYPTSLAGDCEDNALEKRRALVEKGFPRGALRMTTAFHSTQYYAHALLLVETTKGTFVLDQDNSKVLIWHEAPYIFESRELPDGRWERFEQDW